MEGALIGLGLLAVLLVTRAGGGSSVPTKAGGVGGIFAAVPDGQFDPASASRQPDFEAVTAGYDDADDELSMMLGGDAYSDPDWHDLIRLAQAPIDASAQGIGALQNARAYHAQLWRPASRVSLSTITKDDIQRAAEFLGGAWRKGEAAGCPPSQYDVQYGHINQALESEASGLDIGTKIGVGLASIFGYGQAAAASDSSFGFGSGAAQDRKAIVDLKGLDTASQDIGVANAYAVAKTLPTGAVSGSETINVSGSVAVANYPNLFYPLLKKYDPGFASSSIPKRYRLRGLDGNDYIRVGYAYPWCSPQMGCGLSRKERTYVRARMLRVLDMIGCVLYPRELTTAQVGNLAGFIEGSTEGTTKAVNVRYDVPTQRFGVLKGSIFPTADGSSGAQVKAPPPLAALSTLAVASSSAAAAAQAPSAALSSSTAAEEQRPAPLPYTMTKGVRGRAA